MWQRSKRIGRSNVKLVFQDVELVEGIENIVGDWWLYEEVHLAHSAGFDYRVLLAESEFRVVAKEVEFTHLQNSDESYIEPKPSP